MRTMKMLIYKRVETGTSDTTHRRAPSELAVKGAQMTESNRGQSKPRWRKKEYEKEIVLEQ